MVLIKEIQIVQSASLTRKSPQDRKQRIEKYISQHTLPCFVVTETDIAIDTPANICIDARQHRFVQFLGKAQMNRTGNEITVEKGRISF